MNVSEATVIVKVASHLPDTGFNYRRVIFYSLKLLE